jgi:hypothetical protein
MAAIRRPIEAAASVFAQAGRYTAKTAGAAGSGSYARARHQSENARQSAAYAARVASDRALSAAFSALARSPAKSTAARSAPGSMTNGQRGHAL